jgi:serine/threonine-protein kinase
MKEKKPSCPITPIPVQIGPYKILKKIASGGMGEVFLAQDPFCKRTVALKKIRSDLMDLPGLKERFLKEVKIAAQISHPSIIPIYQIHQTEQEIYYTMPVAEGDTLKEILRKTLTEEKQGISTHPIGSSIPALMRIFLSICQAIAYSHSKGILHKDLKPENIIIGKYGEVLILDWGLADYAIHCKNEVISESEMMEKEYEGLTRPGKIAGTLSYLPPERILGGKASYASDIYALGVILYQMLTLRFPFYRKSVRQYRKQMKHDTLIDPAERTPHRDIPPQLSKIAKRCLSNVPEKRYSSVGEILKDLNNYIEGHAEWSPCGSIQIDHKQDWKFQENILLAKEIALSQKSDLMEWVNLMIAKQSFPGNIKFETHVRIKESGKGIGFLLSMNSLEGGKELFQEGFFLWIGSKEAPGCSLFKSNVEIMSNPDLYLKEQLSHFLKIEKTEGHLRFYIDGILAFDYLSHIPLSTPHFGIILKDHEIEVGAILISSSSPNILVNCLTVPDAFLALCQFKQALSEYRQIARSFSGRAEGREAIFRAGITLLEEAQTKKNKKTQEELFQAALDEFGQLRNTPGAPLEYLGKSLVYKATHELEEEVKCLELALRKFAKHPLIGLIKDQILFRLHEAAYKERKAAYHLALLALRFIPEAFVKKDNQRLLQNLQRNQDPLPFLVKEPAFLALTITFYLCKPLVLAELLEKAATPLEKTEALFCLLNLGFSDKIPETMESCKEDKECSTALLILSHFCQKGLLSTLDLYFSKKEAFFSPLLQTAFLFLMDQFHLEKSSIKQVVLERLEKLSELDLPSEEKYLILQKAIECFLWENNTEKASFFLNLVLKKEQENEASPFYFLRACLLAAQSSFEEAKKLLNRGIERTLPSSACLIDAFLIGGIEWKKKWDKEAFFWEKIQLLRQQVLLYRSAKHTKEALGFEKQLKRESTHVQKTLSYP